MNLEEIKKQFKKTKKQKIFCLATTANKKNPPIFFSSIRETENTIAGYVVLAEKKYISKLISELDGMVDYFFIDCEVKNKINNLMSQAVKQIKKSKVFVFKPNDITADAVDVFLAILIPNVSRKKVAMIGAGNLGTKLGLRLMERGALVSFYSRNQKNLKKIVEACNIIKRGSGRAKLASSIAIATKGADIIVGCAPGIPVIDKKHLININSKTILVDVGNGTFSVNAIQWAHHKNIPIYSPSSLPGYKGFIRIWEEANTMLQHLKRKKLKNNKVLITPGIIGKYGDILVDDVDKVQKIYGVCDGVGDVLRNEEANKFYDTK